MTTTTPITVHIHKSAHIPHKGRQRKNTPTPYIASTNTSCSSLCRYFKAQCGWQLGTWEQRPSFMEGGRASLCQKSLRDERGPGHCCLRCQFGTVSSRNQIICLGKLVAVVRTTSGVSAGGSLGSRFCHH